MDTGIESSPVNRNRVLRDLRSALVCSRVVCLGQAEPNGKLASPSSAIPFEALLPEADYILVEADGAKGLPLKAHRPWEPVIPVCTNQTVCIAGAAGIGRPVPEVCHCPDLFASLAGIAPDCVVDPEHIAAVLNREDLADCCLVNQIDALPDPAEAIRLCGLISKDAFPCSLAMP